MFHLVQQTTTERTAAAVRAELARRKMSGKVLAESLGWKRTTTWRRLNGSVPFSLDEIVIVSAFLGVPLADLLPVEDAA